MSFECDDILPPEVMEKLINLRATESNGNLGTRTDYRYEALRDWIMSIVRERDAALLRLEAVRKAWDMIDGWVGCETRSDPQAEKEIQDGVEAMIMALNPVAEKPLCDHSTSPCPRCGRVQANVEKRKGACTYNAVNPTAGHTLCLKELPCPDHKQKEPAKKIGCYADGKQVDHEWEQSAALFQNEDLQKALRALVCKVHEVNKGTEYLFAFAQNHALGKYSGPQYGAELREAERLTEGYAEKPEDDGLRLGESRNLPYPRPISDDDAKKRVESGPKT